MINRAIVPDLGERRGYHRSHVVTPYVRAMAHVGALGALKRFDRYRPQDPIVWRRAGRGIYWNTLKSDSLEHELLALARRRQRGLRQSIATMARWTGSTPDSVTRALKALVRRGVAMLEIGRGRYAVAIFRAIDTVNPATINARAAGLNPRPIECPPYAITRDADGIHDRAFVEILEAMLHERARA